MRKKLARGLDARDNKGKKKKETSLGTSALLQHRVPAPLNSGLQIKHECALRRRR
jgi:hypothetical protein